MTRKSLGYVELEWTCKRCGTVNPGLEKTCTNCGAPMGDEDQFELPDEQKLIEDEEKLAAAGAGADIHCPYCGARNLAGAEECVQCGGGLGEGESRQAGQVMGAHSTAPVEQIVCPFCDSQINANSQRCPNCGGELAHERAIPAAKTSPKRKLPTWMMIALAALVVLCCGVIGVMAFLSTRTEVVQAQVQDVSWQRSIDILEQRLLEADDWEEDIPSDAQNVTCKEEYRYTSGEPVSDSVEVCGTPYTVDTGSGVGEVVQDCEYEVYESFCTYDVYEWTVTNQVNAQGSDLQPYWPDFSLNTQQQEGNRHEQFSVIFVSDGTTYTYQFDDPDLYRLFVPGSEWSLQVNTFGAVTRVDQ